MDEAIHSSIQKTKNCATAHSSTRCASYEVMVFYKLELMDSLAAHYKYLANESSDPAREIPYHKSHFEKASAYESAMSTGVWGEPLAAFLHKGELDALKKAHFEYESRSSAKAGTHDDPYSAAHIASDVKAAAEEICSSIPVLHSAAQRVGPQNLSEAQDIQRWLLYVAHKMKFIARSDGPTDKEKSALATAWNNPPQGFSLSPSPLIPADVLEIHAPSGATYPFMTTEYPRAISEHGTYNELISAASLFGASSDIALADLIIRLPWATIELTWDDLSLEGNYDTAQLGRRN